MSLMSFAAIPGKTPDGKKSVPLNCLWLGTKYWCMAWKFKEAPINTGFESERFTVDELDCEFYFRINKMKPTAFSVELHRVLKDPNERPDDGFVLHFIWSVVGLHRQPKDIYMSSSKNSSMVSYDVSSLHLDETVCWTVKCGFEMCEFTTLNNEAFRKQDELIKKIIKRKKNMIENLAFMSRLLDRFELDNVFSGRQTDEFATIKAGLIERSVEFADDIMASFVHRASPESTFPFERKTELGLILGYIYQKERRCIKDWEVLRLYSMAFRYGLLALKRDCIEYIKNNLEDIDFLLSVLVFCDVQCDNSSLMSTALARFIKRKDEILQSDNWKKFADAQLQIMRSILDTLTRVLIEKESSLLQEEEEVPKKISEEEVFMVNLSISESCIRLQAIIQKLKGKK